MNEKSEKTVNSIKKVRISLDNDLKNIKELPSNRPLSMAYTALESGRMWLGKLCGAIGAAYPYEKTKEAVNPKEIQNPVDIKKDFEMYHGNEIQVINKLREVLNKQSDFILEITDGLKLGYKGEQALNNSYKGLQESIMGLGLRLGEIKKQDNNG